MLIRHARLAGAETAPWNFVANPGFEEIDPESMRPSEWNIMYGGESISVDSATAFSGSSSLRLDARADAAIREVRGPVYLYQWKAAPVTISFYTREKNATGPVGLYIFRGYMDETGDEGPLADLLAEATSTPFTSDWRRHEYTVTPTKPLRGLTLQFDNIGTGAVWIDDVRVSDGLEGAMTPPARKKVVFSETGEMTVDGEPFFPISLMNVGAFWDYRNPAQADVAAVYGNTRFTPENAEENIRDVAAHGFNTVNLASSASIRNTQIYLDIAQRHGLKAIVYVGTPILNLALPLNKGYSFTRYIKSFRDHPALLGWVIEDEPASVSAFQKFRDAYDYLKTLDPDHPIINVTGEWPWEYPTLCGELPSECDPSRTREKALLALAPLGDVIAPDPFPITSAAAALQGGIGTRIARYVTQSREAIGPKQAVWAALQSFPANLGYPRPDQMQGMTNEALASGAQGLMYFAYWTVEHLSGEQHFFLPISAPDLWEAFKSVNANTALVAPAVTAARVPKSGVQRILFKPGSEGIDAVVEEANGHANTPLGSIERISAGIEFNTYRLRFRPLIKFDLSSLPAGKKIDRAVLRLYHTQGATGSELPIAAYGIVAPWDEATVTFENQPLADASPSAAAEVTIGAVFEKSWYRWDITKLVQDWYAGAQPNYGVMLMDTLEEITPVSDQLAVVGESGDTIQVPSPPTRLYYGVDPRVTRGWGAWVAGSGASHHSTSTVNRLALESATAGDYLAGKFSLSPTVPPCTKMFLHYDRSFNEVKSFVSSDSTDSDHWPELIVYYSDTDQPASPYALTDNASEVYSGIIGAIGNQLVAVAAETLHKAKTVEFKLVGAPTGKAVVQGAGREIEIIDGAFRDHFEPSESRIYFITPGAPVTAVSPSMASTTLNLAPVKPSHPKAPATPNVSIQDPLTGASLNLVWDKPPSSKPLLCYLLYQSGKEDAFPQQPIIVPKSAISYTVGGLTSGATTYFRLTAVDVLGNESAATIALKGVPTVQRTIARTPDVPTDGITRPPSDGGTPIVSPDGVTFPTEAPPSLEPILKFGEMFRIHMEGVREDYQRDAVYYLGADGKRYIFPHHKIFETWFPEGATVKEVPLDAIADYPLGGAVTYRPGVRMVKLPSDPKTYAVTPGGELRWIMNEEIAVAIYGADWNKKIDDVSETLFAQYKVGKAISDPEEYKPEIAKEFAPTIEADKGIEPPPKVVETYEVVADDLGLYPSSITVRKGVTVRLTFKVRPRGVYYGGREFRSDYFTTTLVAPGGETTVEFLAGKSFIYTSHRPGKEPDPAEGAVVVK